MRYKIGLVFFLSFTSTLLQAGAPLFKIELSLGQEAFPDKMGWYDPPVSRLVSVVNQTGVAMPMTYTLPPAYQIDSSHSTCTSSLNPGGSCELSVVFNPAHLGRFTGALQVCGHNGLWCSTDPTGFDVEVIDTDIVSKQCSDIKSRPFAALDCAGSYAYAQNFYSFLSRVLNATTPATHQYFNYFQHLPSPNETTVPCLQAQQTGVTLDPSIVGGGESLCALMSYATSNSATNPELSKLFPPYLTFLLGTSYPILPNTQVLDDLQALETSFGQTSMDASVQNLGYNGHVDFISSYLLQQTSKEYSLCGTSETCASIFYLPYLNNNSTWLQSWPPAGIDYWGMSGGGGSGAGYQIQAFKPGSATHYTLFSGGGGGGGGNTTPEGLQTENITLINTGSGGGGGSQFANCYVSQDEHFNGLGLGAGTGSGISAIEGHNIIYQAPPNTSYSYYPPNTHPQWSHDTTLTSYVANLRYLVDTLIPYLYDNDYTITITGGGGGGAGFEFLNSVGSEYMPHPVSIGYGFNFCFVFNKAQKYSSTDCISSSNANSKAILLANLIYKNIGTFFNQGMSLAVSACTGGYSNYQCTCSFQHAYVICELTNLLIANGFTSADIPSWLINPHCNDTTDMLVTHATTLDQLQNNLSTQCVTSIQNFQAAANSICTPPWP